MQPLADFCMYMRELKSMSLPISCCNDSEEMLALVRWCRYVDTPLELWRRRRGKGRVGRGVRFWGRFLSKNRGHTTKQQEGQMPGSQALWLRSRNRWQRSLALALAKQAKNLRLLA